MRHRIFFKPSYIFVIDTDTYSFDFYRQLAAYCTGRVSVGGVGNEYAGVFRKQCSDIKWDFTDLVFGVSDDQGCFRVASMWPTPGFWSDGFGNHWPDSAWGSEEALKKYRQMASRYLTDEQERHGPVKYPAHQSVAMFFRDRPSDELLSFLVDRAYKYWPLHTPLQEVKVLGYRLLRGEFKEEQLWGISKMEGE